MNDIVRYQLRKPAAVRGETFGIVSVPIEDELNKLVEGLRKVYKEKSPEIDVRLDGNARFRGDSGDFLEIAGNLLDNACKWCESKVTIRIAPLEGYAPETGAMSLIVEDDGPGIPPDAREKLLQRGMRLDEKTPGHGIGLAVVKEIAQSYGGDIEISDSPLGGTGIRVTLKPT
jgi:two-component system sensor histidine kinase PhoQ